MKKILSITALWFFIGLTATSCKKYVYNNYPPDSIEGTGILVDTGSPALDGCGWMLRINGTEYSPDNLPFNFMNNNTTVKVVYTISDAKMICGFRANGPNFIHLYDIKR